MSFKDFLVGLYKMGCAILEEDIMGSIHVKFFKVSVVKEEMMFKDFPYKTNSFFSYGGRTVCAVLVDAIMGNIQ